MPIRIVSRDRPAGGTWRAYAVPFAVVALAALLALLFHRSFEAALAVLAPAVLGLCVLAAAAGAVQPTAAAHRARRLARGTPDMAWIVDELAAGRLPSEAAAAGRSWRTLDAVRSLAAERGTDERERIRAGLGATGAWRQAAHRAAGARGKWERVRALHDLGWLGRADAAPLVLRALGDRDDDVAWAATRALGGMESDLAYHVLLDLLEDGRFAASRVAQVLDTSRHADPLPLLAARARHAGPRTLFWIAYLLGRSGDGAALDPLGELARSADADVRAAAAEALGRLGDPAATATLLRMMDDDAWFVRLHACRSLGDLGAGGAVPSLRAAAVDPAFWVRRSAADALHRILGDAA
jgi:hypothetical protein